MASVTELLKEISYSFSQSDANTKSELIKRFLPTIQELHRSLQNAVGLNGDRAIVPIDDELIRFFETADFGKVLVKGSNGKSTIYTEGAASLLSLFPTLLKGYTNGEILSALMRIYLYRHPETILPSASKGVPRCSVNAEMRSGLASAIQHKIKMSEEKVKDATKKESKVIPTIFDPNSFSLTSAKSLFNYYRVEATPEEQAHINSPELVAAIRNEMKVANDQIEYVTKNRRMK